MHKRKNILIGCMNVWKQVRLQLPAWNFPADDVKRAGVESRLGR